VDYQYISTKDVCKTPFQIVPHGGYYLNKEKNYHNLSLGLVTKVRVYKGAGQDGNSGVTSHAFGSVGECEGMNPHTPK
jgi:hypothetical protein